MKYVTVVRITAARPGPIDSRAPRASHPTHRSRVLRPRRSTARVALTLADDSRVPLPPRGPFGAGNGAPGGSFRPAPRHTVLKTAQSRGNLRTHPRCRPERSSRSAMIGIRCGHRPTRAPPAGLIAPWVLNECSYDRGWCAWAPLTRTTGVACCGGSGHISATRRTERRPPLPLLAQQAGQLLVTTR